MQWTTITLLCNSDTGKPLTRNECSDDEDHQGEQDASLW
jgi:hypothetical protein